MPQYLISLTAPKPLVRFFKGRHFLGGRYGISFLFPALLFVAIMLLSPICLIGDKCMYTRTETEKLTSSSRFVTPEISEKYNLQLPEYEGVDQIVEMPVPEEEKL